MKKQTIVIVGADEVAQLAAKRAKEINHDVHLISIDKYLNDAISLDMESRVVVLTQPGTSKRIRFDSLIYCGGVSTKPLSISGLSEEQVTDNPEKISIAKGARAVVLGCGRDGIAHAQTLKNAGAVVSIIEKSVRILPRFSFEFAQTALSELSALGISVSTHEEVLTADRLNNGVLNLTTSLKRTLQADLIVSAIGTLPNTEFLARAGAMIAKDQTVFIDNAMCTTLPSVFACGDAVSLVKAVSQQRVYRPNQSMKERGAQVAAANAVSAPHAPVDRIQPCAGSEIIRLGSRFIGRTGLTHAEARQFTPGARLVRATISSEDGMVRLFADKDTQIILGAEVFGEAAMIGQLDLIAMAVVKGLKAPDLIDLDVSSVLREAAERVCAELRNEFESITGEHLALWLAEGRSFQWLDVDDAPSKLGSYFSRSAHVPLRDLDREFRKLHFTTPVVLSCRSGRSALQAYRILKKKGSVEKIFYLEGGSRSLELLLRQGSASQQIV